MAFNRSETPLTFNDSSGIFVGNAGGSGLPRFVVSQQHPLRVSFVMVHIRHGLGIKTSTLTSAAGTTGFLLAALLRAAAIRVLRCPAGPREAEPRGRFTALDPQPVSPGTSRSACKTPLLPNWNERNQALETAQCLLKAAGCAAQAAAPLGAGRPSH